MLKSRPSMPGWEQPRRRNFRSVGLICGCRFTPGLLRRNTVEVWTLVISTFLLLEQTPASLCFFRLVRIL